MGYAINTMILVIFIGTNHEDTEDSFGEPHDFGHPNERVVGPWLFKASILSHVMSAHRIVVNLKRDLSQEAVELFVRRFRIW